MDNRLIAEPPVDATRNVTIRRGETAWRPGIAGSAAAAGWRQVRTAPV